MARVELPDLKPFGKQSAVSSSIFKVRVITGRLWRHLSGMERRGWDRRRGSHSRSWAEQRKLASYVKQQTCHDTYMDIVADTLTDYPYRKCKDPGTQRIGLRMCARIPGRSQTMGWKGEGEGRQRGAMEICAAHCLQILIVGWSSSPNLNPLYLCATSVKLQPVPCP